MASSAHTSSSSSRSSALDGDVSAHDRDVLRRLAGRVREIGELPEQLARLRRLRDHNDLLPGRAVVLCSPEGAWEEILPRESMLCGSPLLREWERGLRMRLYQWERLRDDSLCAPFFDLYWRVVPFDYGVEVAYEQGEGRGSYHWTPPLEDIERGFARLRAPEFRVDRARTEAERELAQEVFGDLLPVRMRGKAWWTSGLSWELVLLIGLETLMLAPYDQPEGLHRLMGWLRDQHVRFLDWLEAEGLLCMDDGVGSGGCAPTRELPRGDLRPGEPVRLCDMWGFAESQETVGVSPEMFAEFILPYQLPILEKFGLNAYGCCEPLHDRMDDVLQVPRLRRVSVAPWTDQRVLAEKLGRNYVFSRKPNPALVCVNFNEERIRQDLAETLEIAGECQLEIILKDTHTVQNDPRRLSRWVEIAREEAEKRG